MTDTTHLRKLAEAARPAYARFLMRSRILGDDTALSEYGKKATPVEVIELLDTIERLTAERDCRGCLYLYSRYDETRTLITEAGPFCKDCTNGDKFQALPAIKLYKVTP